MNVQVHLIISLLTIFCLVRCEMTYNDYKKDFTIDSCANVCADSFFSLPKHPDAQGICQRGCRFFNIIYLKEDHNPNITKDECYLSCAESYDQPLESCCMMGCKAMWIKELNEPELSTFFVFVEFENNHIALEPELEQLESELISDPLIQSQIEIGYNIKYKIPESKIRTMPIEISSKQSSGDWLDCASRNSGIPKPILAAAIILAILVALGLSFSSEKKVLNNSEPEEDEDLIKCELPPPGEEVAGINAEIAFSNPPKYAIETEKV